MKAIHESIGKCLGLSPETVADNEAMKSMGISVLEYDDLDTSGFVELATSKMIDDGTNKAVVISGSSFFMFIYDGSNTREVPDFSNVSDYDVKVKEAKEVLHTFLDSTRGSNYPGESLRFLIITYAENIGRISDFGEDDYDYMVHKYDSLKKEIRSFRKTWPYVVSTIKYVVEEGITEQFFDVVIDNIVESYRDPFSIGYSRKKVEIAASYMKGGSTLMPWFDVECCRKVGKESTIYSLSTSEYVCAIAKLYGATLQFRDYFEDCPDESYNTILFPMPLGMRYPGKKNAEEQMVNNALSQLKDDGRLIIMTSQKFLYSNQLTKIRSDILDKYDVRAIITVENGMNGSGISPVIIVIDGKKSSERTLMAKIPATMSSKSVITNLSDGVAEMVGGIDVVISPDSWSYERYKGVDAPNYETTALSDIVEIRSGIYISNNDLFPNTSFAGIPYIRSTDVIDGTIVVDKAMKAPSKYASKQVPPGDILLNVRSKNYVVSVVKKTDGPYVPSSTLFVLKLTNTGYDPLFLALYMRSSRFYNEVEQRKTGIAVSALSLSALKEIPVPVLSMEEQKNMVERLGSNADRETIDSVFKEILGE